MPDLTSFFDGAPFDPFQHEPQDDFAVIAPGKYTVLIEKAEVRVTKKQTGHLISIEMQILDEGPFKGRKLFDNINIQNPSAQCIEIGMRSLSALARAIGLPAVKDTEALVNQVVIAHAKVKEDRNFVRTYSAAAQQPAPAVTPGPPVTQAPAPVAPVAPAPVAAPAAPAPVAPVAPAPAPVAPAPVAPAPAPAPAPNGQAAPPWER